MRRSIGMLAILGAATIAAAAPVADPFDACDRDVLRAPADPAAYRCYALAADRTGRFEDALRRVGDRLALDPRNDLARFVLAHLQAATGGDAAETNYRAAIDGLVRRGDAVPEVHARLELAGLLGAAGRGAEADEQLRLAREVAERSGDVEAVAAVVVGDAMRRNGVQDYVGAERALASVEAALFPDGPAHLRGQWLSAMGAALWAEGRNAEALARYRAQAALVRASGDTYEEAAVRGNVALLIAAASGTRAPSAELRAAIAEMLDTARRGGNRFAEARARLYLAQLPGDGVPARRAHCRAAIERLGDHGPLSDRLQALRLLGGSLLGEAPRDEAAGLEMLDRAVAIARRHGSLRDVADGLVARATWRWRIERAERRGGAWREAAIADSRAAFDAIEAIRDLQPDGIARARVFAHWDFFYDRVVRGLLGSDGEVPSRADVESAFDVLERHRARTLLDELDAAGVTARLSGETATAAERDRVLDEIAVLRRRLAGPWIPDARRERWLSELEEAERREAALRAEQVAADGRWRAARAGERATLAEVESALAEDEAMLSFAAGPGDRWFLGSETFLMVHRRGSTSVVRLPPSDDLETAIDLFGGLLQDREGSEAVGAASLHRVLLGAAVDDLGPGIGRWIVIPDGPLHRLSFGALRPTPDAPPIGTRLRIAVEPSATSWLRLARGRAPYRPLPALVVADPEAAPDGTPDAAPDREVRSIGAALAPAIGPLPFAREEARSIRRHLGRRTRILEGAEATEAALRAVDLRRRGLLHFAAHVLVDDARPERSAIVLAPDPGDDGRLHPGEVVDLDLDGTIVVLSGCRSASGAMLAAEGMLSMARPFFAAGARAVVGSLEPLRDDEAAALFDAFYRALGEGDSLGGAMTVARAERFAAGAPAASWAGVVLLGDGDVVPFPRGGGAGRAAAFGAAGAALLAVAAWSILRRRRG